MSAKRQRRSFAMVFKGVSCPRDEITFARYLASAREQHEVTRNKYHPPDLRKAVVR